MKCSQVHAPLGELYTRLVTALNLFNACTLGWTLGYVMHLAAPRTAHSPALSQSSACIKD